MNRKTKDTLESIGVTLLLVAVIVAPIAGGFVGVNYAHSYYEALELVTRYDGYCQTIDEVEDLLLTYEQVDLASGLEAMQLKQTLSETIKLKNDCHANMKGYMLNPLMWHKDIVKDKLNEINSMEEI